MIEDNDLGRVTAVEAGGGCAVDDLGVAGATPGLRVINDEVGLAKTAGVLWAQSGSRCRAPEALDERAEPGSAVNRSHF